MTKVSFDTAIKPIARRIAQLKSDIVYSAALGNYKGFSATKNRPNIEAVFCFLFYQLYRCQ